MQLASRDFIKEILTAGSDKGKLADKYQMKLNSLEKDFDKVNPIHYLQEKERELSYPRDLTKSQHFNTLENREQTNVNASDPYREIK